MWKQTCEENNKYKKRHQNLVTINSDDVNGVNMYDYEKLIIMSIIQLLLSL